MSDKGAQLFEAAIHYDWHLVQQLISPETSNYYRKDVEWDASVLDVLICAHRVDEIKMLVQAKADINIRATNGSTPLHAVCTGMDAKFIVLLLGMGAHINALDNDGETPLMWATDYRMTEMIRVLVHAGADLFHRNKYGKTAKQIAMNYLEYSSWNVDLLAMYERQWINCKTAQIAFRRIFQKHRRRVLCADMVKTISDFIWKTHMLPEWRIDN